MKQIAKQLLKIAAILVNPLNGMRKQKATKVVNKLMADASKGLFSDSYWRGVKQVWEALDRAGIPYTIMSNKYTQDKVTGNPNAKEWKFEIEFANERGRLHKLYGRLVASGAGPIDDPLERYDITVYAS